MKAPADKATRMYILVRKDLNMSIGKLAIQVGHAVDLLGRSPTQLLIPAQYRTECQMARLFWQDSEYKKITLWVKDEAELRSYYGKALDAHLPTILVYDLGLTEFNGIETWTACGVGPWWDEEIKPMFQRLRKVE